MTHYDKDSESVKNLKRAFDDEASGHVKYMLFGEEARRSGDDNIANVYDRLAADELAHAEIWLKELDGIGGTEDNLNAAIKGENTDWLMNYMPYASTADHEGYDELSLKFRDVASVEQRHERELKDLLAERQNGTDFRSNEPVEWRCVNCGYSDIGENAPSACPLCGYPRGYFMRGR